jgi:arsenate reductase
MPEIKHKVLFVCIHNSARSQMAEAFLNKHGHDHFEAESAGIEPGKLNPYVVKVMLETGIDLSGKTTKGVFDLFKQGKQYDVVITVCDAASAERCPVFPGRGKRLTWSFEDPSSFQGSPEEILNNTRVIRNKIEKAILDFIEEANNLKFWMN